MEENLFPSRSSESEEEIEEERRLFYVGVNTGQERAVLHDLSAAYDLG